MMRIRCDLFFHNDPGEEGVTSIQVILSHGNPQMRRTLFDGYLFKYCPIKCQTFYQVSEKTSQQTYSHQKHYLKSFPDASKSHKTCPIELTSGSFLIGRRGILVIPRNRLDIEMVRRCHPTDQNGTQNLSLLQKNWTRSYGNISCRVVNSTVFLKEKEIPQIDPPQNSIFPEMDITLTVFFLKITPKIYDMLQIFDPKIRILYKI